MNVTPGITLYKVLCLKIVETHETQWNVKIFEFFQLNEINMLYFSVLHALNRFYKENCRNYNIKLPRIIILWLPIVSPLHKDPQMI